MFVGQDDDDKDEKKAMQFLAVEMNEVITKAWKDISEHQSGGLFDISAELKLSKTLKMNMNGKSSGFRIVNVTDIKLAANNSSNFVEKSSTATGRVCSINSLGKQGCITELVVPMTAFYNCLSIICFCVPTRKADNQVQHTFFLMR